MPSIDDSMTIGVFRDEAQARQALATLQSADFDQVQFLHHDRATRKSNGLFKGIKRLFTSDNEDIAKNLTEIGVSEADARYYQQEYKAGRIIITIRANERKQEALDTLRRHGAYDAFTRDRQATTTAPNSETAPISEARAKDVVTGQRTLDVPVTHEEVVVEQHTISSTPSDRFHDGKPRQNSTSKPHAKSRKKR